MGRTFGETFEKSGFYWEWVADSSLWLLHSQRGDVIGQVHRLAWKNGRQWQAVTRNGNSMCYATCDGAKLGLVVVMDATLRCEQQEVVRG